MKAARLQSVLLLLLAALSCSAASSGVEELKVPDAADLGLLSNDVLRAGLLPGTAGQPPLLNLKLGLAGTASRDLQAWTEAGLGVAPTDCILVLGLDPQVPLQIADVTWQDVDDHLVARVTLAGRTEIARSGKGRLLYGLGAAQVLRIWRLDLAGRGLQVQVMPPDWQQVGGMHAEPAALSLAMQQWSELPQGPAGARSLLRLRGTTQAAEGDLSSLVAAGEWLLLRAELDRLRRQTALDTNQYLALAALAFSRHRDSGLAALRILAQDSRFGAFHEQLALRSVAQPEVLRAYLQVLRDAPPDSRSGAFGSRALQVYAAHRFGVEHPLPVTAFVEAMSPAAWPDVEICFRSQWPQGFSGAGPGRRNAGHWLALELLLRRGEPAFLVDVVRASLAGRGLHLQQMAQLARDVCIVDGDAMRFLSDDAFACQWVLDHRDELVFDGSKRCFRWRAEWPAGLTP